MISFVLSETGFIEDKSFYSIEYLSHDYEKCIEFLNKKREEYKNRVPACKWELDNDAHFICVDESRDWWYEYWVTQYPEDTNIREWLNKIKL